MSREAAYTAPAAFAFLVERMHFTRKEQPAWVEGRVDRGGDHISISYGENGKAVALVAQRATRGFTVQFLLRPRRVDPRASRILDEVRKELTFYLLDVVGPDSWPFARYHCETPANQRSLVHWAWHSKAAARPRRVSSVERTISSARA